MAHRAGGAVTVSGAERLGGVDENGDVVLRGDGQDPVVVGWAAEEIDGDDRGDSTGALSHDRLQEVGVQSPGLLLNVEEDGPGPRIGHGEGGRSEGESRNDDLITRLDPKAIRARWMAAVPEDRARACLTPVNAQMSASKPSTSGPRGATQPDVTASGGPRPRSVTCAKESWIGFLPIIAGSELSRRISSNHLLKLFGRFDQRRRACSACTSRLNLVAASFRQFWGTPTMNSRSSTISASCRAPALGSSGQASRQCGLNGHLCLPAIVVRGDWSLCCKRVEELVLNCILPQHSRPGE